MSTITLKNRQPSTAKPATPAAPVTLPAPVAREMADQVPTTRLYRAWTGPGLTHPDVAALTATSAAISTTSKNCNNMPPRPPT